MSRQALILSGGWPGHQPQQTSALAKGWLEQRDVEVAVATELDVLTESALAGLSLIVPNWTMGELSEPQERALVRAVEAGCGLAGWHGGMGDAFRAALQYKLVVGGQFVAHPGNVRRYRVAFAEACDPITAGLEPFEIESEQYYLHTDPSNEVLAETVFSGEPHPWLEGVRMPVAWKRRWGAGRVFYCALGHSAVDLEHPAVSAMVRRGLWWAAGAAG